MDSTDRPLSPVEQMMRWLKTPLLTVLALACALTACKSTRSSSAKDAQSPSPEDLSLAFGPQGFSLTWGNTGNFNGEPSLAIDVSADKYRMFDHRLSLSYTLADSWQNLVTESAAPPLYVLTEASMLLLSFSQPEAQDLLKAVNEMIAQVRAIDEQGAAKAAHTAQNTAAYKVALGQLKAAVAKAPNFFATVQRDPKGRPIANNSSSFEAPDEREQTAAN